MTDYQNQLENCIQRLKKHQKISRRNKQLILKFKDEFFSLGMSMRRILKYMQYLRRMAILLQEDFDEVTKEDVKKLVWKMIKAARHLRDKALVSVLYESGCRRGELMALRIKHIQFDDYGCILMVPDEGKTGARRVRLVTSTPYLSNWISHHLGKEESFHFLAIPIFVFQLLFGPRDGFHVKIQDDYYITLTDIPFCI